MGTIFKNQLWALCTQWEWLYVLKIFKLFWINLWLCFLLIVVLQPHSILSSYYFPFFSFKNIWFIYEFWQTDSASVSQTIHVCILMSFSLLFFFPLPGIPQSCPTAPAKWNLNDLVPESFQEYYIQESVYMVLWAHTEIPAWLMY